jgi:hypothetical protein
MTPRQYWTACRLHDWRYMYSDDPDVYCAGKDERWALRTMVDGLFRLSGRLKFLALLPQTTQNLRKVLGRLFRRCHPQM